MVEPAHRARTLREAIDGLATCQGDAPCLVAPDTGEVVTYAGLRDGARALAGQLATRGVGTGARVAFLLDNGLYTARLLLGAIYAGRVPVALGAHLGRTRLLSLLAHSDARMVFVGPEHAALLDGEAGGTGAAWSVVRADPDRGPGWSDAGALSAPDLAPLDAADDALLAYTSGTTGQPKGIVLSQRGVVAAGAAVIGAYALSRADRTLCVLPLSHRSAQNTTLAATVLSGGVVVLPRRFDGSAFWTLLGRHRCTWVALVPAMIAQLLSRPDGPDPATRARLRFVRSSSAALEPAVQQAFESRFGLPLVQGMGQTEAGSAIFSNPLPPAPRKLGSPGRAFGFEVRVVDEAGRALPPRVTGEILVRGESVMTRYHKDPAGTAAVLGPDGWLRTGDLGHLDEDGDVVLAGRARELINKAGVMIAPREIEEVLETHPAVLEAAVVGIADAHLGQDLAACVVLRPGASCTPGALLALCEQALGPLRCPSAVRFLARLPRGVSGKLERWRLAAEIRPEDGVPAGAGRTPPGHGPVARVAPRTPVEEILCEAWAAVLGREGIGVHDDFFALGGDSLRIMRVLGRLAGTLPVRLGFAVFVEHPTVAEQAEVLAHQLLGLGGDEAARRLLDELDGLSETEVAARLSARGDGPPGGPGR